MVKAQGLEEYIKIDWRDILGTNVNDLKALQSKDKFKFTHIMTSAAVGNLFILRILQIGFLLNIPSIIPSLCMNDLTKDHSIFSKSGRSISHVTPFISAELQGDNMLELTREEKANIRRNISIVKTNDSTLKKEQRDLCSAIETEMRTQLINFFGFEISEDSKTWSKGQPFPIKWSNIFEKFASANGNQSIFAPFNLVDKESITLRYDPMPHVVRDIVRINIEELVNNYSENPLDFFAYVKSSFQTFFDEKKCYLLDADHDLRVSELEKEKTENLGMVKQKRKATQKQHRKRKKRKAQNSKDNEEQNLEEEEEGEEEEEEDAEEKDEDEYNEQTITGSTSQKRSKKQHLEEEAASGGEKKSEEGKVQEEIKKQEKGKGVTNRSSSKPPLASRRQLSEQQPSAGQSSPTVQQVIKQNKKG